MNKSSHCPFHSIAPILFTISALAQDSTPPESASPDLEFRVIRRTITDAGDHFVVLNRVAPPVLPSQPAPVSPSSGPPLSAEAQEAQAQRDTKRRAARGLSATVYDRQLTQLCWSVAGQRFIAFSNIDFNFLSNVMEIETEDTVYQLLLAVTNEARPAGDVDPNATPIPPVSWFSPIRSEYLLLEDEAAPLPDGSVPGLDAIHMHFDAHRQQLIADYAAREAARLLREQWLADHPPEPVETTVNFWPSATTNFIDGQTQGVQP